MKKFYFIFLLTIASYYGNAQTLFTFGGIPVGKEEFLRAYNKNKTYESGNSKALREYLDLYIRFKLKVQAAKDLRIDTLSTLQQRMCSLRWRRTLLPHDTCRTLEPLTTQRGRRWTSQTESLEFCRSQTVAPGLT